MYFSSLFFFLLEVTFVDSKSYTAIRTISRPFFSVQTSCLNTSRRLASFSSALLCSSSSAFGFTSSCAASLDFLAFFFLWEPPPGTDFLALALKRSGREGGIGSRFGLTSRQLILNLLRLLIQVQLSSVYNLNYRRNRLIGFVCTKEGYTSSGLCVIMSADYRTGSKVREMKSWVYRV